MPRWRLRIVTWKAPTIWPRWSRSRANYEDPRTEGILERQRIRDAQRRAAPHKPYHGSMCPRVPEVQHPPGGEPATDWVEPIGPTGLRDTPLIAYWDARTKRAVLLHQQQEEAERLLREAAEEPLSPGRDPPPPATVQPPPPPPVQPAEMQPRSPPGPPPPASPTRPPPAQPTQDEAAKKGKAKKGQGQAPDKSKEDPKGHKDKDKDDKDDKDQGKDRHPTACFQQ